MRITVWDTSAQKGLRTHSEGGARGGQSQYIYDFSEGRKEVKESCSVVSDSLHPMDYTVHGILQARILEWVVFPFSRGSSQPRDWTQDLPNPGIEPRSSTLQADSLPAEPQGEGGIHTSRHTFLAEDCCGSWEADASIKNFSPFLAMRRCEKLSS